MAFTGKEKTSRKKSTFKSFGNFIAMHMVRHFVRRSKTSQPASAKACDSDKEAFEAGFDAQAHHNGYANGKKLNGVSRSSSLSAANHHTLSIRNEKSDECGVELNLLPSMPGVFGLTNHGNTCFMNSVTQCLSNTDLLGEYFVMGQYKQDLKSCRKDRSKKYGTKGEVTEQFANIIRCIWMGTCTPDTTKTLKETIGKFASQYKGTNQHDSQEFLLWLLDKMHEDLNMQPVKKKSFVRRQSFRWTKKTPDSSKGVIDCTSISSDLSPTSFIQKVFQGHYRSSLTCPTCKKKSDTIDPYLCVSLPLKQRTTRPVYVNVVFLPNKRRSSSGKKNFAGRTIKIAVAVEADEKINHLRQAVAGECGIHSRLLAFVDLQHDGFHQSYGDDKFISDIPLSSPTNTAANMSLYAFELPPIAKMTAGTLPRNFASKHKKRGFGSIKQPKETVSSSSSVSAHIDSIVVILINKQGVREQGKRFGRPLVFRTSRDVLLGELQSMVLSQMSGHLKSGVKHERLGSLFRLQVVDGLPNKAYLPQQVQQPLRLPTIDRAMENSPAGGPLHVKLVAEWDTDTKAGIFEKFPEEKVDVQESVRLQKVVHQQPVTCTLEECFDLHTQEETLGAEDGWTCQHCRKQQRAPTKKLSLFTLPDIFVLHLKRFRVQNGRRMKLTTRVEFPVTGLDMSKHLYSSEQLSPVASSRRWGGPAGLGRLARNPDDSLYDLYAVCNHYGNLNSGHYTACCTNPLDGRWYLFDDASTDRVDEGALSRQAVYILFYQRRSSAVAPSCGGASVNTVMSDHWAFSLPQFKRKVEFNSQHQLNSRSVAPVSRTKTFPASPRPPLDDAAATMQTNINNNSAKIAAAREAQKRAEDSDDDDGGFASPSRPQARGLRRQGSAVVATSRGAEIGRERQYRSYRHNRATRRQQSSQV